MSHLKKSIISLIIWLCGVTVFFLIILAQGSQTINPLNPGFIVFSILTIILFLPLIYFSYYHAEKSENLLLIKLSKHLMLMNLIFIALAFLLIGNNLHKHGII